MPGLVLLDSLAVRVLLELTALLDSEVRPVRPVLPVPAVNLDRQDRSVRTDSSEWSGEPDHAEWLDGPDQLEPQECEEIRARRVRWAQPAGLVLGET